MENASDSVRSVGLSNYSPEKVSHHDSNAENTHSSPKKPVKLGSVNYAAQRLKRFLHWPKTKKERPSERLKKLVNESSETVPVSLRQRFLKPSPLPNNKRAQSVRSNVPSPIAKKKLASGMMQGVMQSFAVPPHKSRSSSFSKLSFSSQSSLDTQKAGQIESEMAKASCSIHRQSMGNRRLMNPYLCFGGPDQHVEAAMVPYDIYERSVLSAA